MNQPNPDSVGTTTTVENKSGLHPLGHAVLVKMYEPEKKSGLIEIPDVVKERSQVLEQRCIVIEVGPSCWDDEPRPRAKPGDKVIVTKFAGYMAVGPKDGQLYRLVNDRDIFCSLEDF
jgi:co-chaperonin GroES (HSP10)